MPPSLMTKKKGYEKVIYHKPYKLTYGYWKWKGRYFITLSKRNNKGKYIDKKRWYFITLKIMHVKLGKVKKSPHYYWGK